MENSNNKWMYTNYNDSNKFNLWKSNIKDLLSKGKDKEYIMELYDLKKGEPMYIFTLGLIEYLK